MHDRRNIKLPIFMCVPLLSQTHYIYRDVYPTTFIIIKKFSVQCHFEKGCFLPCNAKMCVCVCCNNNNNIINEKRVRTKKLGQI